MKREDDKNTPSSSRRGFLRGALLGGAGLIVSGCVKRDPPQEAPGQNKCPEPPKQEVVAAPVVDPDALPENLDKELFHLHTRRPLTLEAKRSSMGIAAITPLSRFFVRNNLPMPSNDIIELADAWEIEIGGVKNPGKLTLPQLKQLGATTIATVLQCSGNGRKFYKHGPSGSQWATGASGCAMWTGVPVSKVVEHLGGVIDGVKFMTSTGGEELPADVDPLDVIVERSILKEKGLQDCLLAWEMNGQPIPLTHGGPLRLIVPGYYGCNQIKYIKKLAFTAEETEAKIQRSGYRFRDIGEKGAPTQPSMWAMSVKSWVNGPGADGAPVLKGKVQFHGVAFAGEEAVEKVEVSLDDGKTWKEAAWAGLDLGKHAWRTFVFEAELSSGEHTIHSRATSVGGEVQPEVRAENERGYGHNGWRDHGLTVKVVDVLPKPELKKPEVKEAPKPAVVKAERVKLSPQGERGRKLFASDAQPSCTACHTLSDAGSNGAVGPNLDQLRPNKARVKSAVTNGVGSMPPYKGNLKSNQIEDLAQYVFEATKKK